MHENAGFFFFRMNTFLHVALLCQNGIHSDRYDHVASLAKRSPVPDSSPREAQEDGCVPFLNASGSPGCSPTRPLITLANLDMATLIHLGTRLSPLIPVPAGRHVSNLVESQQKWPGSVPCPREYESNIFNSVRIGLQEESGPVSLNSLLRAWGQDVEETKWTVDHFNVSMITRSLE